ncbi:MAG: hypothetical protein Q9M31_04235 [Mariprofundus sp.]|nr:hypothetical protein [Mariprofundus sp.]
MYEKIKRNTPALVEQTLANHGEWDAVTFLLISHRLRQSDYEAWRIGEVSCLEKVIAGNQTRMIAMLDTALAHGISMGLIQSPISWLGWGKQSGKKLRLFDDEQTNNRFQLRLAPKADRPQLDLFMDAPHTLLLNRLRQALLARSPEQNSLFDRALSEISNEPALARLDAIRAAMNQSSIDKALGWLHYLNEVINPAVSDEFPRHTLDIMAPLWRQAATALLADPFDPAQPLNHASAVWMQAHAWEACLSSIAQVPNWHHHPYLHALRIEALSAMGHYEQVRCAYMLYCWLSPEMATKAMNQDELQACGLQRQWLQFIALENAPSIADFPAMVALQYGQAFDDAFTHAHHTDGYRHYQLLCELLDHEKRSKEIDIALRSSLKHASPWLFHAFMAMASKHIR